MIKRTHLFVTLALVVVLALAACNTPAASAPSASAAALPTSTATSPIVSTAPSFGSVSDLEATLEHIYAQVNPSVVTIRVLQKQEVTFPAIPEIPGFPFFFGNPQGPQEQYQQALGSGFVWDKEGHIVTNNHVVAGADRIAVVLYDGTTIPGTVVGTDPNSDLAVVKVNLPADRLQPVQLGDSTQVKVGQLAIAIGNPFGEQNTMTVGFVSALARSLPVNDGSLQGPTYTIPDVIQTDAPINPGNSGGVLVNDQGQVIGVTSAIESPVRASAGIGFAIPSTIVQKVVPALIKTGHYEHTWLGISGTTLSPSLAQAMGLSADQRGALVVDVTLGSPADRAGLRGSNREVTIEGQPVRVGGDVILGIDGQTVKSFDDLVTYLARSTEVGQTVSLTVLRDGKQETLQVTLAARPASETQSGQTQSNTSAGPWLGITGVTLTPEIDKAMNLPSDQQGVLVEQVASGSPAEQAGLVGSYMSVDISGRRIRIGGDVIVALDGQTIDSLHTLQAGLQHYSAGQVVTLAILRNGLQMDVQVMLGESPVTAP